MCLLRQPSMMKKSLNIPDLETHFIDSSGLISWDLFKQDADYPFVDWNFSGTTKKSCYADGYLQQRR
ncbi:hypothetical protein ACLK1T_01965 [Escherichia coli]